MPDSVLAVNAIHQPFFEPLSSLEPPSKRKLGRIVPDEYKQDSITKAKKGDEAWGFIYPSAACQCYPEQLLPNLPNFSRPKLEAPQLDVKGLPAATEEIGRLISKTEEVESAENHKQEDSPQKNLAELSHLQNFIQCMKTQRDQYETNAELTLDAVQKKQDANNRAKKDYFNRLDEHIEQKKISNILKWVKWILWGGLGVIGLASLGLAVSATGGLAVPAVIGLVVALTQAGLAISSGSVTITKGVIDYNNKKALGTLEARKYERMLNSEKIREGMNEMRQSMDVISENWKELVKVVNNWYHASLNRA